MGIIGKIKSWISKTQIGTDYGYKPAPPTLTAGSGFVSSTSIKVGGTGQAPSYSGGGKTPTPTKTGGGGGGGITTPTTAISPTIEKYKLGYVEPPPTPFTLGVVRPKTPTQIKEQQRLERIKKYHKVKEYVTKQAEKLSLNKIYGTAVTYAEAVREPFFDIFKGKKKEYEKQPNYNILAGVPNVSYKAGAPPPSFTEKITPVQEESRKRFMLEVGGNIDADIKAKTFTDKKIDEATKNYNNKISKLQGDYNSGKINYTDAVKESEKIYEATNKELNSKINTQVKFIYENQSDLTQAQIKQRQEEWTKKGKLSVLQKLGIGAVAVGSWSIPVIGAGFKAVDITQMAVESPSLVSSFVKSPVGTIYETAPYVAGGILVGGITRAVKTNSANAELRARALEKQKNLKLETAHDISITRAIKIGVDASGKNIYDVNYKVLTRIINKKTGGVVEKIKTLGRAEIVADSKIAIVKSFSAELKNNGVRNYVKNNKLTITSDLTKATGIYNLYGTEKITFARGKIPSIMQGKLKIKALPTTAKITAKMKKLSVSKYSAMVDSLSWFKEKYPEVKNIKGRKIQGTEYLYEGINMADVYKNLINVKGYKRTTIKKVSPLTIIRQEKIKPYLRRPAKEMKPFRSIGKDYSKIFIPEKIGYKIYDVTGKNNLQQVQANLLGLQKLKVKKAITGQAQALAEVSAQKVIEQKIVLAGKYKPISLMEKLNKNLLGTTPIVLRKQNMQQKTITKTMQTPIIKTSYKINQEQLHEQEQKNKNILRLFSGVAPASLFQEKQIEKQNQNLRQQQQQQQKQQQKLFNFLGNYKAPNFRMPRIKTPEIKIPPFITYFKKPKYYSYKKQLKNLWEKGNKQIKKYQSSVGAYELGIYAKPKAIKKIYTGLEIRPQILTNNYNNNYAENYNKQLNKLLVGGY